MQEVWIIDAARSPRGLGRPDKGSLARVHPQRPNVADPYPHEERHNHHRHRAALWDGRDL